MSLYGVLLFISALLGLSFSLVVFVYGKDKPAKNFLSLYNLVFSLWCLCQLMGEIVAGKGQVLFWTRANLSCVVFMPVLFVSFVNSFLGTWEKNKRAILVFYLFSSLFLVLVQIGLFMSELSPTQHYRYYPRGGFVYAAFAFFFIFQIISGFVELFRGYADSEGARKNQIIYIITSSFIGFGAGILWFLPVFGVDIYPFGIFIMPLYLFIGAYAIIRHRLLDIKIIVSRGISYALLLALFTGLYMLSFVAVFRVFQSNERMALTIPAIVSVLCFAVFFDPLRKVFERFADRVIFGDKYDYQTALKKLSFAVASCLDLESLVCAALSELGDIFKTPDIAFYLENKSGNGYRLIKNSGFGDVLDEAFPKDHKISSLYRCELSEEIDDPYLRDFFLRRGVFVYVPLIAGDILKGFILIGRKSKNNIWSHEDVNLLETFSSYSSVALRNIFLCEEIKESQFMLCQAEKLSAIGVIASEMAHEIRNPLTSIRGMVQVFPENVSDKQFTDNFFEIIPRQIDRIGKVVDRLLKLAGNRTSANERNKTASAISVSAVIDDVLKLVTAGKGANDPEVIKTVVSDILVVHDREQLEQAFLNIILNAVQAMPQGGKLKVFVDRGIIEISDTGQGIKNEDLKSIFDPFYTTKENGSGLGLPVTKKILEEVGANIEVDSTFGKGTKVTVMFK